MQLSEHHQAKWVLSGVAFLESSIFPIPPDLFLVPMALANRQRAFMLALYCTIFSVLGGLLGYLIGAVFYETLGIWILNTYNAHETFVRLQDLYLEWGFWIVFAAGLTPFPYKVITIASGVMAMNLPAFILGSLISRGLRFFMVAALLYCFGQPMRMFIEKYFNLLVSVFFLLLLGGFLALRWL